ncbi:uncharacterized protein LOC135302833 isoform X3 [Passer domesticus]|uniref:uncharacterized protein LOC135302833 isoform X3 n=1 Tax=Passer domesticus TaxID=48849 RepID=UPI0030FE7DA3
MSTRASATYSQSFLDTSRHGPGLPCTQKQPLLSSPEAGFLRTWSMCGCSVKTAHQRASSLCLGQTACCPVQVIQNRFGVCDTRPSSKGQQVQNPRIFGSSIFSFSWPPQLWSCVKTPGADRGSLAAAPQSITAMETARNSVYDIWRASTEVALTIFSPGHACICKVSTIFCPTCHDSYVQEEGGHDLQSRGGRSAESPSFPASGSRGISQLV